MPLAAEAASHFFQVVSRRYEHGSIVLTTKMPRAAAEQGAELILPLEGIAALLAGLRTRTRPRVAAS